MLAIGSSRIGNTSPLNARVPSLATAGNRGNRNFKDAAGFQDAVDMLNLEDYSPSPLPIGSQRIVAERFACWCLAVDASDPRLNCVSLALA